MFRRWLNHTIERLKQIPENQILTSFLVLIFLGIFIIGLSLRYYINDFVNFYPQVLAEAHGMLFDIAVIGILIFYLNRRGDTRHRIRTYIDEIDDFRLWESEEAAFRTVGNIKRLNRHKIYNLNLVDCFLTRTNLNQVILNGSNLNDANLSNSKMIEIQLMNARLNQTRFENSNLNQGNLQGAYASGAIFDDAYMIKTNFQKAFLIKSSFKNGFLMEADLRGAYVMGADFENASLYKADLRNVNGLTIDQLMNVKTLYFAKFDPEIEAELKKRHPEMIEK